MKAQHLVFYSTDADKAKAVAAKIRKDGGNAQIRQAMAYRGETEPEFDTVVILSDVGEHDRARIERAYGDKVQVPDAPKPKLSLPPAPPPSRGK